MAPLVKQGLNCHKLCELKVQINPELTVKFIRVYQLNATPKVSLSCWKAAKKNNTAMAWWSWHAEYVCTKDYRMCKYVCMYIHLYEGGVFILKCMCRCEIVLLYIHAFVYLPLISTSGEKNESVNSLKNIPCECNSAILVAANRNLSWEQYCS